MRRIGKRPGWITFSLLGVFLLEFLLLIFKTMPKPAEDILESMVAVTGTVLIQAVSFHLKAEDQKN